MVLVVGGSSLYSATGMLVLGVLLVVCSIAFGLFVLALLFLCFIDLLTLMFCCCCHPNEFSLRRNGEEDVRVGVKEEDEEEVA